MPIQRFEKFQKTIWEYYKKNKRDFPWRNTTSPYQIYISEIMLQQTQAKRVIPKYKEFLKNFPNFKTLATAPLSKVLIIWKGLGYNRRALHVKRTAEIIVKNYRGKLPSSYNELAELPGIGPNTAGSILAFAYNIPIPFIETNIRSVYIHFFFEHAKRVHDREIFKLVEKTIDSKNPREWYYALMDYGAMLKLSSNPSQKSRHYTRQTTFKGSHRELRANILHLILNTPHISLEKIMEEFKISKAKAEKVVHQLLKEGFIIESKKYYKVI